MSSALVVQYVRGFLDKHPRGEVYAYFRNVEGTLDEYILVNRSMLVPMGEQFILIINDREDDFVRLKNMADLYEIEFATGEDGISPAPATSPVPSSPGAPAQVE